jgi:hypothetical protein
MVTVIDSFFEAKWITTGPGPGCQLGNFRDADHSQNEEKQAHAHTRKAFFSQRHKVRFRGTNADSHALREEADVMPY